MLQQHPVDIPPLAYDKAKAKHYFEYLIFRAFSFILELLPLTLSFFLVHRLADLARIVLKKKSKETLLSIQEHVGCDSSKAQAILKGSFRNFAENWVHLCRSQAKLKNYPELGEDCLKLIQQAQQEKRGIVFAAGHFGWWEMIPKILFRHQLQVAITVAVQHNPLFDKYVNSKRTCDNFHAILHNRLGIRHTFNYLKHGGFLIVLSDVDIRNKGIPIPFMGKLASTSKWPAELALRTDSLLCNARFKIEEGKENSIVVTEAIDPRDYQDSENAVEEMLTTMNERFADFVLDTPEQWFWLQRRWKTKYSNES